MAFFCIILSITGRIHLVIEDQVAEEKTRRSLTLWRYQLWESMVADLVAVWISISPSVFSERGLGRGWVQFNELMNLSRSLPPSLSFSLPNPAAASPPPPLCPTSSLHATPA